MAPRAIPPFVYRPDLDYVVKTESAPGSLTEVYRGRDLVKAESIANFWDERVNTYITHPSPPTTPLDLALDKLDQLEAHINRVTDTLNA